MSKPICLFITVNQTPNLSATLQAAVHGLVSTTQSIHVDPSTLLMRQAAPLSLYTPHSVNSSFTTSSEGIEICSNEVDPRWDGTSNVEIEKIFL